MARKLAPDSDAERARSDAAGIDRREYVKLGAAAAAVAGLFPATGAARADGDTLVISGDGSVSTYEVTVDGDIERIAERDDGYGLSGGNAEGAVTSGTVGYRLDGPITDFRLEGEAGVYVNGERVDPTTLGTGGD